MLSVAYLGISIPLFWVVVDLEGNSCSEDRISLLMRVVKCFGAEKIEALLADRVFVGKEWFHFLIAQKIPFVIRIKQNSMVKIEGNVTLPARRLRKWLGQKKVIGYSGNLWGHALYISIERRKGAKESMMIVASNFEFENPLGMYRRRWEIETLFGCLKTRGFRKEDMHITDPDKIEKLIFVLAIAFCWAYRTGDIRAREKPIEVKTHGRKARSLFREGVNLMRRAIFDRVILKKFRQLISCFTDLKPMTCGS
jgi:hypothetical protein